MSEGQIKHMKGDIVPPDDWYHFNCECKNYASFPFHRLLMPVQIPQLEEWFEQIYDAADPGDVNMLFFKITRVGKFVAFEADLPFDTSRSILYIDSQNRSWEITDFDSFFELNKEKFQEVHTS